jgi:predicted nicotinamide N-methyase
MTRLAAADLAELDRRFDIVEEPFSLPMGPVVIEKPRDPDDLISEADFVRDERLPYWADLWPSAIVLASFVEERLGAVGASGEASAGGAAPRAFELGCGLGLVTVAAVRAGYRVTATDYYEDALLFTARNTLRATGQTPEVQMVDWRALPSELGHAELVLAADVLYEPDYGPLVAQVIKRLLAPGGRAFIADQGRLAMGSFLAEAESLGLSAWEVLREERPGHGTSQGAHHTITIHELTHG